MTQKYIAVDIINMCTDRWIQPVPQAQLDCNEHNSSFIFSNSCYFDIFVCIILVLEERDVNAYLKLIFKIGTISTLITFSFKIVLIAISISANASFFFLIYGITPTFRSWREDSKFKSWWNRLSNLLHASRVFLI